MGITTDTIETAYREMVDTAQRNVGIALPETADQIRISMAIDASGARALSACVQRPCPHDTDVDIMTGLGMADVFMVNWLPEPKPVQA